MQNDNTDAKTRSGSQTENLRKKKLKKGISQLTGGTSIVIYAAEQNKGICRVKK